MPRGPVTAWYCACACASSARAVASCCSRACSCDTSCDTEATSITANWALRCLRCAQQQGKQDQGAATALIHG